MRVCSRGGKIDGTVKCRLLVHMQLLLSCMLLCICNACCLCICSFFCPYPYSYSDKYMLGVDIDTSIHLSEGRGCRLIFRETPLDIQRETY